MFCKPSVGFGRRFDNGVAEFVRIRVFVENANSHEFGYAQPY
jgi:hypothetical protein